MKFQSTRNKNLRLDSAETIIKGLSDDGGLFVPVEIPKLENGEIAELSKLDYCERAKRIFAKFLRFAKKTNKLVEPAEINGRCNPVGGIEPVNTSYCTMIYDYT